MFKTKKSSVPKALARQIKFGQTIGLKGATTGTVLWAGGTGLLLQQIYSGGQSKILPAIGATGAIIGGPLMQLSKPIASRFREKNLQRLVGKRRLALATAERIKDPSLKAILLILASAKTVAEKEAVKRFIQEGINQQNAREILPIARRAIELENTYVTKKFHRAVRALRGIEARKLDAVVKKLLEELGKKSITTNEEYQEKMIEYLDPYAVSHTMDVFKIHSPGFGSKFIKLKKAQRARAIQKIRLNKDFNVRDATADVIMYETATGLNSLLVGELGTSRNAQAFINYYEQVNAQLQAYTHNRLVESILIGELRRYISI